MQARKELEEIAQRVEARAIVLARKRDQRGGNDVRVEIGHRIGDRCHLAAQILDLPQGAEVSPTCELSHELGFIHQGSSTIIP